MHDSIHIEQWLVYGKDGFAMVPFDVTTASSHTRPYTRASHARPAVLMFSTKRMAETFRQSMVHNVGGDGCSATIINKSKHVGFDNYINSFAQITVMLYNRDTVAPPFPTCSDSMIQSDVVSIENIDSKLMSTLFITAYALFLYIDQLTEIQSGLFTVKGFIMDPFTTASGQDIDFDNDQMRSKTILSYLESK